MRPSLTLLVLAMSLKAQVLIVCFPSSSALSCTSAKLGSGLTLYGGTIQSSRKYNVKLTYDSTTNTWSGLPLSAKNVEIFANGLHLYEGDWTQNPTTGTLSILNSQSDWLIRVNYDTN